ncbi:MAG: Kynurenine formamidase [Vampirovibrio sp.]|nr:Kynurenine formamidase [Vampirovibrio sp.]
MLNAFDIIDISQPVSRTTACFPGDVPFSREVTVSYESSQVINLCAFTMSPHVGTHADAPVHIYGDMNQPGPQTETIGQVGLSPFIGQATVVDVSPWDGPIAWEQVAEPLSLYKVFPQRILFKTANAIRHDVFEDQYAHFTPGLIAELAKRGVVLVGLDTPSVDAVDSKTLETHHALLTAGMSWLENLDLTGVSVQHHQPQDYFLVALPLKLMELEASPVRAVLLKPKAE